MRNLKIRASDNLGTVTIKAPKSLTEEQVLDEILLEITDVKLLEEVSTEELLDRFIYYKCYKCTNDCAMCKYRSVRAKNEKLEYINNNYRWILKVLKEYGNVFVNIPKLYPTLENDLKYFGFENIAWKKTTQIKNGIIIYATYKFKN